MLDRTHPRVRSFLLRKKEIEVTWKYARELKALRNERGLTTHDLEALTGGAVTRSVIANIECGRKNDLTVGELVSLAEALGVQPFVLDPRVAPDEAVATWKIAGLIDNLKDTLDDIRKGVK